MFLRGVDSGPTVVGRGRILLALKYLYKRQYHDLSECSTMARSDVRMKFFWPLGLLAAACGGPTIVPLEMPLASVVSAGQHSCGLTAGGSAFCWGSNTTGELGIGSTKDQTAPAEVAGGLTFASLYAGWGHTCGLTSGGDAYCWGLNLSGQLGTGETTEDPVTEPVAVSGGHKFVSLSLGGTFTCGMVAAGTAYCWGWNQLGQLGDGTQTDRSVPTAINITETFKELEAGALHVCAVSTTNETFCWGSNSNGQLGLGATGAIVVSTPTPVPSALVFTELAMGFRHTCALEAGGDAYCWGGDDLGQLGVAGVSDLNLPVLVATPQPFVGIFSGAGHFSCGTDAAGTPYCWGGNSYLQLGHQSDQACLVGQDQQQIACTLVPTPMTSTMKFSTVAPGLQHTCGVAVSDQLVYCWGGGNVGELGNGQSGEDYYTMEPQLVVGQKGSG